jgi:hypothetical protein
VIFIFSAEKRAAAPYRLSDRGAMEDAGVFAALELGGAGKHPGFAVPEEHRGAFEAARRVVALDDHHEFSVRRLPDDR